MKALYTIGFTKKDARTFFGMLVKNDVRTLIDVRLNNVSQLAAFTKRDDLKYFLELHGIGYLHFLPFAPTADILDDYKKQRISWKQYETDYAKLMKDRSADILAKTQRIDFDNACLLCSEPTPECCHRRLAAEWLKAQGIVDRIHHL